MRLLKYVFISFALLLIHCSNPSSSSKKTVVSLQTVSITNIQDTDTDGYWTDCRVNFDVDVNRGNVLVDAFLWRRVTGTDTFYLYGYIEQINIEGETTSDASYFTIGYPYEALPRANYDLLLEIYLSDTPDEIIAEVSAADPGFEFLGNIGFEPHFQLTFYNPVFTDIEIEIIGGASGIIPPGGNIIFPFNQHPGIISYEAATSGKTNTGEQIGLEISWEYQHNVSGFKSASYNLVIPSAFFFLYIQNYGIHVLSPLYVNYGDPSYQTVDNLVLPADNVIYKTGYYYAFDNYTQVRAYWQGTSSYTYWNEGTHFFLPFTDNQSITLGNQFKSAGTGVDKNVIHAPITSTIDIPVKSTQPVIKLPEIPNLKSDYGKARAH